MTPTMADFNRDRFDADFAHLQALNPQVLAPDLQVHATLPSTNQATWTWLNESSTEGIAVLALEQTSGRGQWGRQWTSGPGGLYLSVGLLPDLDPAHSAQLTIATAWGLATALRHLPFPVQLKWPNDLVLEGRKLGGILTETRIQQGRIAKAVIGIGLNWQNSVPELAISLGEYIQRYLEPHQAKSLAPSPLRPALTSLESLTALTLYGILSGYARWKASGIDSILPEYWNLLTHRNTPIEHQGQWLQLVGITTTGELRARPLEPTELDRSTTGLATSAAEQLLKPGTISLGYESLQAESFQAEGSQAESSPSGSIQPLPVV
jgi:BirA family transcriptional regulator, biotin operon repressor / biotin---[acetyl-CoA-carboxylase] ligase